MARSSRKSWCLSALLLLAACAHGVGSEPATGDQATAQRIYMVAEERYAAGDFDPAVELMRHALLQLPASPEHDQLRHKLILRMAHTQLRAHAASGQAAQLVDAQQMLTRYLVRHEQLFGENAVARAERGEVYELLFLVEQQLEPVSIDVDGSAEPTSAEPTSVDMVASAPSAPTIAEEPGLVPEPPSAAPEPPVVATASAPASAAAPAITSKRHVDANGSQVRDLVVHERRLATLDDPRVVQRLRSEFSSGWANLQLTAPGIALVHGPRPLVRGTSRLAGPGDTSHKQLARRAGQSLLQDARVDLRGCYAAAFARQPVIALRSTIEASIHPDGSVSHVRIVDGGLVDGYGDACVIEAMQGATLEPLVETEEPVRVELALTFFYESSKYIFETWNQRPPGPRPGGLPPIDQSARRPQGMVVSATSPRAMRSGSSSSSPWVSNGLGTP